MIESIELVGRRCQVPLMIGWGSCPGAFVFFEPNIVVILQTTDLSSREPGWILIDL
jgi:hypothetical protein